ncbi:OmpA family protein [Aquiflexum lacus]|uniref:OmpA family protein n=1 Tax=Aquiflexum lacus TaxID=2483805 RepID=UPI0018931594|nr:OmpA family protein [Aquiflexum lacus]
MKKLYLILSCFLLMLAYKSQAQQKDFGWRLGVSGGYTNYYGDLSPQRIRGISNMDAIHHVLYFNENYFEKPSFKVSLEKQLSATIGLMFSYGEYHFAMSDRYIQRDGSLMLENPNFDRGLNFSNHTRDMGVSFVFKADNDIMLPAKSWIAPYFTLGFGLINFEVKGDLLDADGLRYDYNSTNIIHNSIYETDLHAVRTELINGYELGAFYTNLGLGFRIRLGNRFEVFAQSDLLYTFTDYLDDVSGKYRTFYENDFQAYASKPGTNLVDPQNPYRGNPNSANDWIIYHGVGIKYNLGVSKKTFSAPRLSTYYPDYGKRSIAAPEESPQTTSDSVPPESQAATYNYTYNIQLAETEKLDSLRYLSQILAWDQEIQKRENKIVSGQVRNNSLLELRRNFDEQNEKLIADEFLDPVEKEKMIQESEKNRFDLRYSIDSIGRRERELKMEIDSISRLKRDYRLEQRVLVVPPDLDSRTFEKEKYVSDSAFQQARETTPVIRLEEEIESASDMQGTQTTEGPMSQPEQAQRQEIQPTPSTWTRSVVQDPETMSSLEEENRYLRSERDRLLIESTQQSQQQRPQNTRTQRSTITNRQTTIREESPRDESDRRRRWWWPFAAAGGVAATAAILSNNDGEEKEPMLQDSTDITEKTAQEILPPTQKELDDISMAITSSILGTTISAEMLDQKEAPKPSQSTPDIIIQEVVLRDTVYLDNEPVVTILKSKEVVFFKVNQRIPDRGEINKLSDLANFIKENGEYGLVLTGFADNTGNVNYNLKLADERMKNVGNILSEEFSIPQEKLRFESGGQVIRGTRSGSNDLDRKVEVRAELIQG